MADVALMVEGQEDLTWERLFRLADAAEELGFESLFRSDHLTSLGGESGRYALALWPSLTALAERTSRIRFGPLVCSITFRHPVMVAKMAASVDELSGGRLDLGIGAGWNRMEHEMFGIEYPPYAERLDRLDEGAGVIRGLWSGAVVSRSGRHYSLAKAEAHPTPAQPDPVLIMGGTGDRTLQVVARHASEWNAAYTSLPEFIERSAALDRACEAIDRVPTTVRRSIMVPFAIGRDDSSVQDRINAHRSMFSDLPEDATSWREAGLLAGSPQAVVDQIGLRIEAGATRFMLQHNDFDDLDSLSLVASEVLPHV